MTRAGEPPVEARARALSIPSAHRSAGRDRRARGDEQQQILERLGFRDRGRRGDRARAGAATSTAPADLVEEVIRIVGYDAIPSTPLPRAEGVARPTATRGQMIERRVRRAAAARGLDEAVTWSFIGAKRGRAVRRRAARPRQSDQRGNEAYAPVADPRPCRRGAAQRRSRRGQHPPVRDRPALSGRWRAADGRPAAGRRARAARLAGAARPRASTRSTPRPKSLALLEAAGAPVANLQLIMGAGRDLASGPIGDAWAGQDDARRVRRTASARRQGARCAGRNGRRRNLSRRHPGAARDGARARRLRSAARCRP